MIVSCPSCATEFELDQPEAVEAAVVRCDACGHAWLEATADDISDIVVQMSEHGEAAKPAEQDNTEDRILAEARKIARVAQAAEHKVKQARAHRMSQLRGWAGLATGVALVLSLVVSFPERIVQAAPGAAKLYSMAGKQVNIFGLTISGVEQQYMMVGKQPVLALRGQIANVTGQSQRVPALRFTLKDASGKALHSWTLPSTGKAPIGAGVRSSFVTRLAAPPEGVDSIEIRFAKPGEMG